MSIPKVLCVGKAAQDVFLRDDEFDPKCEGDVCFTELPLGAKMDIDELIFATGGNATNVATTLSRQGLHAQYLWALGHDPASVASLTTLDEEGIDTSGAVQQASYAASYSTVLIALSGERTIMNYQGKLPSPEVVEKLLDSASVPDWVYPTSVGGLETLERVVLWAEKHGVKVMLNPAGSELKDPAKLRGLLESVEVLCLNKEEMQQLVEGDDLETLVRHGLHYCPVVIVSDGPRGVCASDGKTIVMAGMYEDVPVVDRTGAGDAFASGFLSQWLRGKSLKDSIVFGSANSTSVVGQIGAKAGILRTGVELHDMPLEEKPL